MKLGIIGTVMKDRITTVEGETFESFGGILYNLMALSSVIEPGDELRPYCFLSPMDIVVVLVGALNGIEGVNPSNLMPSDFGTDSNELRYVTTSSRREKMSVVTPSFTPPFLEELDDLDAVLINFISGHELDLDTFRHIRANVRGLVYLDVHNLGKKRRDGVPVKGHVFESWPEWISQVDIVQANEWEAERFFAKHPKTEEDFREAALKFLSVKGPRVAALTLGPNGVALAWRDDPDGEPQYLRIPAMPQEVIVDTTGCGDSFSAGFMVEYLKSGCPVRAAVAGSTLSGLKCRHRGLAGRAQLAGSAEAMEQHFGAFLREWSTTTAQRFPANSKNSC